jgi:hypothetical protein
MKNFGCLTILVLVLATLIVLLVPWLNAQACDPKPTPTAVVVPQVPPGDRDCRKGCKDEPRHKPNPTARLLPEPGTVPYGDPPIYLPLVVRGNGSGSARLNPYPAP